MITDPPRSAAALLADLRAGRTTARALVEAHLARIAAHDPQIHAVVHLDPDGARRAADALDARRARGEPLGPLAGLPMTVKDGIDVAGQPTTLGLPWMRRNLPAADADVTARLRAAGAILLGKTAVPFASYDYQTAPPGRPRTTNPHDPNRTPAGSSGGPAAALAAGFTALEVGSDVAGSIRLPAAFCGVVGLRPSEGALPQRGHAHLPGRPTTMRHLSTVGPLARTAEDCALLFDALRTPTPTQGPDPPLHPAAPATLAGLRLGYADTLCGVPLGAAVRDAFADFRRDLADRGVTWIPRDPADAVDLDAAFDTWGRIQGAELRLAVPAPARWPPLHLLLPVILRLRFGPGRLARAVGRGARATRSTYLRALDARDALAARFDRWLADVDAWILPAGPVAFPHQRTGAPIDVDGRPVPYGDLLGVYHCPLAAFGVPVLTLPIAPRGLPIGLQLVTPRWHDLRALALGVAIEQARGPGYRPPAPLFDPAAPR